MTEVIPMQAGEEAALVRKDGKALGTQGGIEEPISRMETDKEIPSEVEPEVGVISRIEAVSPEDNIMPDALGCNPLLSGYRHGHS